MEFQVTVDELDDGSKCNEAAESCQLSVTFVMLIYLFGLSMLNIRPLSFMPRTSDMLHS